MIWWLYELVFWPALILAGPYYLLRMWRRGGYAEGFLERFGVFNRARQERLRGLRPVWIHAVSVGEVDVAVQLIEKLRQEPAAPPMVLSTTTSTGHAVAARKLSPAVPLFYFPLDSRFCFARTHRLLRPRALILVEAELWPNQLHFCREEGVPLILVNARLSPMSFPRYRRFRWLLGPVFRSFRLVTVQTDEDVARLAELGFASAALNVVGSLKYDAAQGTDTERRARLMADLAAFGARPFWVAGSTHPGEEEILLEIYLRAREHHPDLVLALAPRHAERSSQIERLLRRRGLSYVLRTNLEHNTGPLAAEAGGKPEVLLLNTTGELKYLYEHAALIFIGKSLVGHGGQNPIEPAALGKAVILGPHMENFPAIVGDFLSAGAAIQVRDGGDLGTTTLRLLGDRQAREELAARAAALVRGKRGAVDRTVQAIGRLLREVSPRQNADPGWIKAC